MKVIEVEQEVGTSCMMGMDSATTLTADLSLSIYSKSLGELWLAGMCDLGSERSAHIYWNDEDVIRPGDRMIFLFRKVDKATPPLRTVATDDPGYLEGQADLEEFDEKLHRLPPRRERFYEKITLEILVDGEPHLTELRDGEERIIAGVRWDVWHPERCSISASAFGQLSGDKRTSRQLFWQEVGLGQRVEFLAGGT